MKKKSYFIDKFVNILFCLAIITCCIVMVYALILFISNCGYLKSTISDLASNYDKIWSMQVTSSSVVDTNGNATDDSANIDYEKLNQISYMENLVDYTMKLQELEAKATSTNMMTFIYTFLSGTLIGVATYFTKKSSDSIKQIKENKELITNLDSRTLFANFYMHTQQIYSAIQIFVLSLDSIQDEQVLSCFIDKNVPRINDFMQEMVRFVKVNQENMSKMNDENQKCILREINGIGQLVNGLHSISCNALLNDKDNGAKSVWEEQLKQVKKILRH